jgi:hypothetical protein
LWHWILIFWQLEFDAGDIVDLSTLEDDDVVSIEADN